MTATTTDSTVPCFFTVEQLRTFRNIPGVRRVEERQISFIVPIDYEGPRTLESVTLIVPFWYALLPNRFRKALHIRIGDFAPGGVPYQVRYKSLW